MALWLRGHDNAGQELGPRFTPKRNFFHSFTHSFVYSFSGLVNIHSYRTLLTYILS